MRYIYDHDLHIHSQLSLCSDDPEQTPAAILRYAEENHLHTICLTDHYWDETVPGVENFPWYGAQNTERLRRALPLPQTEGIRFLFGCETELKADLTLGISKKNCDLFDFIIIPTTHLHMNGFTCRGDEDAEERAALYIKRFDAVLDMDLPFHKIGIAHLTCSLMYRENYIAVLQAISDEAFIKLFRKAKERGVGIELNFPAVKLPQENVQTVLRPYQIAKEEGCKFYIGSDAHHPRGLADEKENAETIIRLLDLKEPDKFTVTDL